MAPSEYQELVEFLSKRFAEVGDRFTRVEDRLTRVEDRLTRVEDRLTGVEDRLTRAEVYGEESRHLIQIVAEGVTTVDRKLEALRDETREGFLRVDERLIRIEVWTEAHHDIGERVARLEAKRRR